MNRTTRRAFAASLGAAPLALSAPEAPSVQTIRVPDGGIQPKIAGDSSRALHLIYYRGEPAHGDLFYVRSGDEGATFSAPIRVNSQPGSAVAAGTIRGGQIAVGRDNLVHVAWNGSSLATPAGQMLYARLDSSGKSFEVQRNLMTATSELDGGGSIAADRKGGVYVAWHGRSPDAAKSEGGRQVFLARSKDDGKTFTAEKPAWDRHTGACGCCGMSIFANRAGALHVMFRSATEDVHRDIYLLTAAPGSDVFSGGILDRWNINACPMSSMSFHEGPTATMASWETAGQVYFSPIGSPPVAASDTPAKRKHSYLATNGKGQTLMAWIEGSGWQKGGALAWRLFDASGKPLTEVKTEAPTPTWSFAAPFARRDGGFTILY